LGIRKGVRKEKKINKTEGNLKTRGGKKNAQLKGSRQKESGKNGEENKKKSRQKQLWQLGAQKKKTDLGRKWPLHVIHRGKRGRVANAALEGHGK